ncbi:Gfo/Idh/MocA family oxidoreductase [Zobellia galactanivorans]|uniref:Gfo/Idh/MocA family protein n=1 Tax=Zobellia galactanivorans (strain DSM 12802 / CCUG 47099 / CIP 106680 / NCIMB 13871 / Dsij) TaxID=63186 RepID=UPI0026E3483A|nr:Gfo/Idh/MocA family oxidoreductase [Zobellia galactanivorans]MDO6807349.1 Gfo/Idh/MocA family oxidoreductase [Zobellia galactanivorans]
MKQDNSRRYFLKKAALGSAAVTSAPLILSASKDESILMQREYDTKVFSSNDQIQLALIGTGIQGIFDTKAALTVSGIKLVAACDLYTGRLERAKELWGDAIFTTRDYREILKRKDIDAVIIATPDHWHKQITINALKAGKHVYCEKPMVQEWQDGQAIIDAQKASGKICQVGSQGMASLGNEKAKQLYQDGAIGDIVMLDFYNDRYSAEGAWQYPIPPDANKKTVDFDTFLGQAPKVKFEPKRFFRWRNYRDYGTGVAGDLFVHAFSTLNYVIDSHGPNRAMATGGLRYWKDGRDVPDVSITLYDYPKTATHAAFNAAFRINFIAGSGGGSGFKLIGTEGEMEIGQNSVSLKRSKLGLVPGGYSMISFPEAMQEQIRRGYAQQNLDTRTSALATGTTKWQAPKDYKGGHHDHFYNFFTAIRENGKVVQDPTFGLRAAGAALLANESYYKKEPVNWNPEEMKIG